MPELREAQKKQLFVQAKDVRHINQTETTMGQSFDDLNNFYNLDNRSSNASGSMNFRAILPQVDVQQNRLMTVVQPEQSVSEELFSIALQFKKMQEGPIESKHTNPYYEEEQSLQSFALFKFILLLFCMITITASYLNVAAAQNPWSMES